MEILTNTITAEQLTNILRSQEAQMEQTHLPGAYSKNMSEISDNFMAKTIS